VPYWRSPDDVPEWPPVTAAPRPQPPVRPPPPRLAAGRRGRGRRRGARRGQRPLTHTAGVTIANSTVSGLNATTGRVSYAIDDVYGDSTGTTVKNNDISNFRTAIQMSTGLIAANYLHDPGYIAGDHTNGIYAGGGTQPLTVTGNTILLSLGQTDAINLDAGTPGPAAPVASKTITGNFLAGGSYTIYAGAASGSPTTGIVIQNNRFGQNYYAKSGQYGPVAYYDPAGTGNTWTGNVWDTTAAAVTTT
jgi:hypothetical protein